ncbi:MAG TPA: Gfo/Idh/MocA family oxidoreductase, partial [Methylomirabilota bacterium]|nr:Gfo/Idh/MocA family oxidoreductase [Methylomirabilota bacterium]
GILGTGDINDRFLPGARLTDAVEVVAVGSRTAARAAAFAERHDIPRAHGTYEELLADPGVEAIYNALPNSLHHEWTLRSLAAGKHVLCEKPYTRHPAEVDEAFDAAERAGLVLSEAFMWRHHPQARRLVEGLPGIGPLQAIRATFGYVQEGAADVRLRPDLDGGSLMDVGCYCVSGSRLIAGEEPDVVYGVAQPGPTGVDIRFSGMLHFPSGVVAEFTSGFTSTHHTLEAMGSGGSLMLTNPWQGQPVSIVRDGVETKLDGDNAYRLELEDVGRAIRGEGPPLLGREDAMGQARTLDGLLRSAETGQPVRL